MSDKPRVAYWEAVGLFTIAAVIVALVAFILIAWRAR